VADLASRVEITKLAQELGMPEERLGFLADRTPTELKDLRALLAHATFSRN